MISIRSLRVKTSQNIKSAIKEAAKETFRQLKIFGNESLSVILADDDYLQNLNRQYRSVDKPTDVLSFSLEEDFPDQTEKYLGDVVISITTAERQAAEAGHSIEDEISLLTIHGILHLLGYDHDTVENKRQMWQLQESVLQNLGIKMSHYSGDYDE